MYDINKLKQLREQTGISFSVCKKALEEGKNDLGNAKKWLKKYLGIAEVKDKSTRNTANGAIFSYVHHNKKIASLIELACETDFVSGNKEFQNLGQEIAMQVASTRAATNEELLKSEYMRDPSKKINDLIKEAVLKFGENIKIIKFIRWNI